MWGLLAVLVISAIVYTQWKVHHTLDNFREIDRQLATSDSLLNKSNKEILAKLNSSPIADSAHRVVDDYCNYIDTLHQRLIDKAGGLDENGDIVRKDDIDISTQMLAEGKEGKLLYQKLLKMRATLIAISPQNKKAIESLLTAEIHTNSKDEPRDWLHLSFYHIPVTAAVTILSKYRSDALKAEELVLNGLQ